MGSLRILASVWCGWCLAASVAVAGPPDYAARLAVEGAVAGLGDPLALGSLWQDADDLMADLGLAPARADWPAPAPVPDFAPTGGAVVELVDLRLLLTQIAVQTGADDHLSLTRAQGDRAHKVILLRGGFVTLPQLLALARGTPAEDFIADTAGGLVFARPLAIWNDAGLHLDATDRLLLNRASGSFVANLGWLSLSGGTVAGSNGINMSEPAFRPFILTAGTGSLTAQGAILQNLGFGETAVFGGVSVVNNGLRLPLFPSQMTGSTLTDVTTLSLVGTQGATVSDNHLSGATGAAILVSQSQDALIAGNTLENLSGPQGIRITADSRNIAIVDNALTGGARTGILIDQGSSAITVDHNIILSQLATGLTVSAGSCVWLRGNLITTSGGSGITISDTGAVYLSDNAILFNGGAAVLIRDQSAQAFAHLAGNVLIGNREGLRGATPGVLVLDDNDLDGQLPRVFTGDLAPLMVDWLRDQRAGTVPATPVSAAAPCAIQGQG